MKITMPLPCEENRGSTPEEILQTRRDIAEAHMRSMGSRLWRANEDVTYTLLNNILPEESDDWHRLAIRAGRLYQGVPYSFAGCADAAFWDFAGEADERGILPVSGLHWKAFSGSGVKTARIGNDCASAVMQAWSRVGSSIQFTNTKTMTRALGYLPVGEYATEPEEYTSTKALCRENGEQTMFEAYACLRKADALVCREPGFGHALMVVRVEVIRRADGSIDGDASFAVTMEQSRMPLMNGEKYFHPGLQEDVYITFGLDRRFSFREIIEEGYLPVTCRELVDPAPAAVPTVWDSPEEHDGTAVLSGVIHSNWPIDCVTIAIADAHGAPVQEGTVYAARGPHRYALDLRQFVVDTPEQMRGRVAPEGLPAGSYRCTITCRLSSGQRCTVRDFAFEK